MWEANLNFLKEQQVLSAAGPSLWPTCTDSYTTGCPVINPLWVPRDKCVSLKWVIISVWFSKTSEGEPNLKISTWKLTTVHKVKYVLKNMSLLINLWEKGSKVFFFNIGLFINKMRNVISSMVLTFHGLIKTETKKHLDFCWCSILFRWPSYCDGR